MIKNQKQEKFLSLYKSVEDNIWRYCLFMTKNRDKAKDLLGETITIAYEGFDRIRDDITFLSWLFTIASRTFYRSMKYEKKFSGSEIVADSLFNTDLSPEILTDISLLYENLNKLPEVQKEAVILFNIEGMTRKEIALIQGANEETVKTRLASGRKRLAILMGASDE
jgi:RNA polymerase sigma-70 factor (ECF subfamily)